MSKKTVVVTKKAAKKAAPAKAAKKAIAKKAIAPVKAAKAAKVIEAPAPAEKVARETKKGAAIAMLKEGVTIFQLMEKFGWLRHTTRGFLSILGRTHKLETFKNDKGEHTYKLAA